MAYSKKNMIKTLEVAKEYLKSGYIKGKWICKKPGKTTLGWFDKTIQELQKGN